MISVSVKINLAVTWSLTSFAFSLSPLPRPWHSNNHHLPVISASTITLSYHHTLSNLFIPGRQLQKALTAQWPTISCPCFLFNWGNRRKQKTIFSQSPHHFYLVHIWTISWHYILYPALSSSQYEWHTSVFMSRTYLCTFTPEPILSSLCKDLAPTSILYLFFTNIFISKRSWCVIPLILKNSLLCMPCFLPAVATYSLLLLLAKLIQRDVYCLYISLCSLLDSLHSGLSHFHFMKCLLLMSLQRPACCKPLNLP